MESTETFFTKKTREFWFELVLKTSFLLVGDYGIEVGVHELSGKTGFTQLLVYL